MAADLLDELLSEELDLCLLRLRPLLLERAARRRLRRLAQLLIIISNAITLIRKHINSLPLFVRA